MRTDIDKGIEYDNNVRIFRWLTRTIIISSLLLLPLAFSPGVNLGPLPGAFAAQGGNGGGNGGNGNGGSDKDKGDEYGDMVYLKRDSSGVPILDGNGCLQPMGWDTEFETYVTLPLYWDLGDDPDLEDVPDLCEDDDNNLLLSDTHMMADVRILEAEDDDELDECDVITICADNMLEVNLGRLSMLRSPQDVLDRQLNEVLSSIETASHLALDPGGRLMVNGSTMDSPLANLAMYREFHRWWQLQNYPGNDDPPTAIFTPPDIFSPHYTPVLAAAFGIGAGDDKLGAGIDIEVLVRSNATVDLPGSEYVATDEHDGFLPTIVFNDGGNDETLFINYDDFEYDRTLVFPGCITWDYYDDWSDPENPHWVFDNAETIIEAVFGDDDEEYTWPVTMIEGFALAANDARRVLVFVHDIGDDQLRGRVDMVFESSGEFCPP